MYCILESLLDLYSGTQGLTQVLNDSSSSRVDSLVITPVNAQNLHKYPSQNWILESIPSQKWILESIPESKEDAQINTRVKSGYLSKISRGMTRFDSIDFSQNLRVWPELSPIRRGLGWWAVSVKSERKPRGQLEQMVQVLGAGEPL